jgi:CheY-like chemotaxis protein
MNLGSREVRPGASGHLAYRSATQFASETGGSKRSSEEPMGTRIPKVLLIGENAQGSSYLAQRLQGRGFECCFATSYQEACSLLMAQGVDLVLSPMRLRDESLFPLMAFLDGSGITLFYYHAVEDGCLWLPALRRGQKCFGSSALRPSEFVSALDEVMEEIRFREATERKTVQSITPRLPRSVALLLSSRNLIGLSTRSTP